MQPVKDRGSGQLVLLNLNENWLKVGDSIRLYLVLMEKKIEGK